MSYARLDGKSKFYAFHEAGTEKLKIYPDARIGDGYLSLNRKEAEQLKMICEKYLKELIIQS